ncbi:MAG: type II toxin-antitoxin system RelE/ParE family toxin [Candidatus Kerfeldbacteria bacterium]|nr:type II toxin-antitoxin system RelE/ParE family toxin [Candidatus Kerfeldbacteria bacterium]
MDIQLTTDVEDFVHSLESSTIAKILRTIDLLEHFGHRLGMPHSKKMRDGFFELRIRGRQEVRIFYIFSHGKALLVHAFIKKSQKTPQKELKLALSKILSLT